jgi:glycosyltransferase involved in cell wall biosynthesis
VPVVSGLHNYLDGYGTIRRVLDSLAFRPDSFVAVSDGVAASYERVYKKLAPAKVCVIEDGIKVPTNDSQLAISRGSLYIPESAYVIGTVGRFEPEKNQRLLVAAFSQLVNSTRARGNDQELSLLLVGYGSLEGALREQVTSFGLEKQVVFIIGQQADDYYSLFDCFVLSSPSEGLSLALLEAMVRSIPCVVTNNEAHHPALVNEQNGLVVSNYDEFSLGNALLEVLSDKKAACRMGIEAKKTVLARYTVERMARSYRDLFNHCIEK